MAAPPTGNWGLGKLTNNPESINCRWVPLLPPVQQQDYFPTLHFWLVSRQRVLLWPGVVPTKSCRLPSIAPLRPTALASAPNPRTTERPDEQLSLGGRLRPAIICVIPGAKMLNTGTILQAFGLLIHSILSSGQPPYESRPILLLLSSLEMRKQGGLVIDPGLHSQEAVELGLEPGQSDSGAHIATR